MDYFGQQFDIHGGGHDLRFPHHEAEIFQGECHTGCSPLVHHWMHNGFVNIDGEKMSKSLGNFWTIRDIVEKVDPYVLRFALVNAHYRSPIDMNEALLKEAQRNQNKILDVYSKTLKMMDDSLSISLPIADITSQDTLSKALGMLEKLGEGFALAMDDDFNSRNAVAKVLGATREIQKTLDSDIAIEDKKAFASYSVDWLEETAGQILGVLPTRDIVLSEPQEDPRKTEIADEVEKLLSERTEARAAKDWSKADLIRDKLKQMGVVVIDTSDGPTWDLV